MNSHKLDALVHRPLVVLLVLLVLAAFAFAAVHRLVNRFGLRQRVLGAQIYYHGLDAQRHQNPATAIADFREARAYLATLAERAPQDGDVNLELARLAARDRDSDDAILHYHRAIYGLWSADPDSNRRRARLELVDYLLQQGQRMNAQAELIALAANVLVEAFGT